MSSDAKPVKGLINRGMDPNARNEHGPAVSQTACGYQGSYKNVRANINAAIEVLMEADAEVNPINTKIILQERRLAAFRAGDGAPAGAHYIYSGITKVSCRIAASAAGKIHSRLP